MSNVFRNKEFERELANPTPVVKQESKLPEISLEDAAALAGVELSHGYREEFEPDDTKKEKPPWLIPFWFIYESGDFTVVYSEAERVNKDGEIFFATGAARNRLRDLLVLWGAAKRGLKSTVTLPCFAGTRGFTLKAGRGRFEGTT